MYARTDHGTNQADPRGCHARAHRRAFASRVVLLGVVGMNGLRWVFDQTLGSGMNSRTSCAQRQATAILAAHCSASSREGTSMIVTPAMYALLPAPSVTVPSRPTTVTLTSWWEYIPPANTHTPASCRP